MKFSFIIPALNEEDYIEECILSIKRQLEKGDEIIVVDNGSKDKTVAIAEGLGAKVVKESQKGISHARNKGAKVAKGDILAFVDSDMVLSRKWLAEAKKSFSNPRTDVVVGLNIFEHPQFGKMLWYNTYTLFAYGCVMLSDIFMDRLLLSGNNLAMKRGLFTKLGGFEPVIGEDYWMSRKFWKLKKRRGVFNPNMIIYLSSRGFDSAGYAKTISFWIRSTLTRANQEGYSYKNKEG